MPPAISAIASTACCGSPPSWAITLRFTHHDSETIAASTVSPGLVRPRCCRDSSSACSSEPQQNTASADSTRRPGKPATKAKTAEAKALTEGRNEAETEELRTALGAGGTGKGTAGALRGATGAIKDLEKRQKSRQTRASRDALDRALIDLATHFRDALLLSSGADQVTPNHPDMSDRAGALADHASPERLLRCIEAVLQCREALAVNVKPKFAVDAMVATIGRSLRN